MKILTSLIIITFLSSCAVGVNDKTMSIWDTVLTTKELKNVFKHEVACEKDIQLKILSQEIDDLKRKSLKDPSRNMQHLKKGFYRVTCGREVYACKVWAEGYSQLTSCKIKMAHQ